MVERLHDSYVSLLCRYLRWSYGASGARRRLGHGVSVVALAKEAYHIWERRVEAASTDLMAEAPNTEMVVAPMPMPAAAAAAAAPADAPAVPASLEPTNATIAGVL